MTIKRILTFSSAIILGASQLTGCAEIMKGIAGAAEAMVQPTSTLDPVAVRAQYTRNIYPKIDGLAETNFFGDQWVEGGNILSVVLQKRDGIGMYKVDGSVSYSDAQGQTYPLKYIGLGGYMAMLPPNDVSPKTVTLTTSSGNKVSIPVTVNKPMKVLSINGQSQDIKVDMGKDAIIKLQSPSGLDGSKIKVSLVSYPLGIATWSDFGVFKPGSTLRIPAAAFRHPAQIGGGGVGAFGAGKNYLKLERFIDKGRKGIKGDAGAIANLSLSLDTVPITLVGNAPAIDHINVAHKDKDYRYSLSKSNAFYSPPMSRAKKVALTSLSVWGGLYDKKTTTSSSDDGHVIRTTTTTVIKQFPQLPNAHWDRAMDDLYKQVQQLFARRYKTSFTPVSKVVRSRNYKNLFETPDSNTARFIERSYQGTKDLLPQNLGDVLTSVSSTIASDTPTSRLLSELNVDGLMNMKLRLFIGADRDNKIILSPALSFNMTGEPNGYMSQTNYFHGSVSGKGVPFNGEQLKANPALLSQVINVSGLVKTLGEALDALEAKEKEAGYHAIWANR